ncbi:MAG: DUF1634 domain-containing protein [Parachlamydiales bacterium]|nr:DUF1634 domain-containing protein [Parachlamydiales bacterium]
METKWNTRTLQVILTLSIGCILIGEFLYLKEFGNTIIDYSDFSPICLFCNELKGPITVGAKWMSIGLILFITLPIIRLVAYFIGFCKRHEKRYVRLSLILILMIVSGYWHHVS